MKNPIVIDFAGKNIFVSKSFLAKSQKYGTTEYFELMSVQNTHKGFNIIARTIKKPDHTIDRHKGLGYKFMKDYIARYEPEETRDDTLAAFEHLTEIGKAHTAGRSFNAVKKWFLARYPEVDTFTIGTSASTEDVPEDTTEEVA